MSIRMNLKIEQALTDINDIKARLQALESAYSAKYEHNDFLPTIRDGDSACSTALPPVGGFPREKMTEIVSHETKSRTKKIDKRTKAYRDSRNSIKNEAQVVEFS